ncbi:M23 family metallopeptidase [Corynebacterium incognita]|uniref:M23 family metallopeptidase n=1 Tax=Corynebacterium incognita TaxID=2754725 RepID=A0A7G7CNM1_9CORY|nr:M23 family metallopeptidase [Corynebacterium incognita]QNE89187.1 M23 family metallopeptidase [Corynebacterium incognita]
MKRTATAAAIALALGLGAPVASAATPAATLDFSTGSSKPQVSGVDNQQLFAALRGLAESADSVMNADVIPKIESTDGSINIVLDPQSIPALAEAFAPDTSGTMTAERGQHADGRTVVFPTSGTFTSGYGQRWGAVHNGIDIANPIGTPIYAVMDGTVIDSGPARGYGNWIRIQHDNGEISVYGHMSANTLAVGVGERVTAGQQIAAIGNEGQSTGPHLHFEIWPNGASASDPVTWFQQAGITVR